MPKKTNTKVKVNAKTFAMVKRLGKDGLSPYKIAPKVGLSHTTVYRINKAKTLKDYQGVTKADRGSYKTDLPTFRQLVNQVQEIRKKLSDIVIAPPVPEPDDFDFSELPENTDPSDSFLEEKNPSFLRRFVNRKK